jgi:hypothetical protein
MQAFRPTFLWQSHQDQSTALTAAAVSTAHWWPQCVTATFEQGSFSYFDFELHRMASVPGVPGDAAAAGLSGWTERTSRPDFVFERR